MFILGKTICFLLVKMKARLILKEQKKLPNKLFIYFVKDMRFIFYFFNFLLHVVHIN